MKKTFRKNEKGLTLIEILVATALFSITVATLTTGILFALKVNKDNHYASEEIQTQMNAAENYSDKDNLNVDGIAKYKYNGTNKVTLSADFGGGISFTNDEVYAFQAIKGSADKTATYRMRFFDAATNSFQPDPDKDLYWIRIYNYSPINLQYIAVIAPGSGAQLLNADGDAVISPDEQINISSESGLGSVQYGLSLKRFRGGDILGYTDWANINFFDDYVSMPDKDFTLTEDNFDSFLELDADGDPNGYLNIFYDGSAFYTEAQVRAGASPRITLS